MRDGDIFDIGQTVNGQHMFMWLHGRWYYYEPGQVPGREYEYPQEDLMKLVMESLENEDMEVIRWGNFFGLPGNRTGTA